MFNQVSSVKMSDGKYINLAFTDSPLMAWVFVSSEMTDEAPTRGNLGDLALTSIPPIVNYRLAMRPSYPRLLDKIEKFIDHMGRQADEIEGAGGGNIADEIRQDISDTKLAFDQLKKELARG